MHSWDKLFIVSRKRWLIEAKSRLEMDRDWGAGMISDCLMGPGYFGREWSLVVMKMTWD